VKQSCPARALLVAVADDFAPEGGLPSIVRLMKRDETAIKTRNAAKKAVHLVEPTRATPGLCHTTLLPSR